MDKIIETPVGIKLYNPDAPQPTAFILIMRLMPHFYRNITFIKVGFNVELLY